eukprot:TRINITY_DN2675_c0_g1_i10.p3 TRINITY_DN2675_c0_g1~~TRINITY_DN2675_c0_g1_i10.p3  ORF type:complete len:151 (-),score=26.15 TRINITY_DN2675_c0_g1_i10:861-1313(-)
MKELTFDGARQSLIDILHNYCVFKSCRIIIVFDAHKVIGNVEKKDDVSSNISVIFTKDGETADSYIEKKVNQFGRKYEIVVITSDNLEQQTIFQRGAIRMSSLEFYNEILNIEKTIKKSTQKNDFNYKNNLSDNIPLDIVKKLEQMRRSE